VRRLVGNVILLLVTLILLDLLFRLVLGGSEHAFLYLPGGARTQCCGQLRSGASVEYTGWFLRIPGIRQEVNSLGYRGAERPPAKPSGVYRIAVVGDSYTYGLGVASEDSLPAQLESVLARARLEHVEVLNFGVPGAAIEDAIERVRCFAGRWEPDLVLFLLYADDLEPSLCSWKGPSQIGVRLVKGNFRGVLSDWRDLLQLAGGVVAWQSPLGRACLLSYRLLDRWRVAVGAESDSWPVRFNDEIDRMADATEQVGATLAVVALGDPSAYRRSPHLAAILDAGNVHWLDARAWLFGERDVRLPVIPRDMHLSAEGNRLAAERVAAWLLGTGVLRRPVSSRPPTPVEAVD
jgi:hypothetical protein